MSIQIKIVNMNPFVAVTYMVLTSLLLVFYLPVWAYNLVRLDLLVSILLMLVVNGMNLFYLMRNMTFR